MKAKPIRISKIGLKAGKSKLSGSATNGSRKGTEVFFAAINPKSETLSPIRKLRGLGLAEEACYAARSQRTSRCSSLQGINPRKGVVWGFWGLGFISNGRRKGKQSVREMTFIALFGLPEKLFEASENSHNLFRQNKKNKNRSR